MGSPDLLDFDGLITPISESNPTGADSRRDISPLSNFQKIKEDRKLSRTTETQNDRGADLPPPNWRPLIDFSTKLLSTTSKDMEVVAYLIEGLTRVNGFAGIRDGFKLASALVETFGNALYPDPDDSDIENRFSHLLQLNGIESTGALIVPIAKIPFTSKNSSGEYSLTHFQTAQSIAKISDPKAREARANQLGISMEVIQKAATETPAKFYIDLVDDIHQSLAQIKNFSKVLDEKLQYDASSGNLETAIEAYLEAVMSLAGSKIPAPSAPAEVKPVEEAVATTDSGAPASAVKQAAPGEIRTREDALEALQKVAEYFRKTEPHSVVPFGLEQVIHWGRLSLPDLLAELIPDDGPRLNFFKQVGIKQP